MTTEKRLAKRQRIVDTALRLFSERGFGETRMADVAAALGLQAGSLYYYFDSKEALLAEVVERQVSVGVDALRLVLEGEGSSEDRIRRAIATHLEVFDDHADLYSLFHSERLEVIAPELAALVDERGRAYEQLWVGIVEEAIADGTLRGGLDPWLTMKAIVGLCNSTLFWFEPDGPLSAADLSGAFADLVLRGLAEG